MRWRLELPARLAARIACGAALAGVAAGPGVAWAADPDPTYGRINGDLTAAFGLGATVASQGVRAEAELRLRYLETAGAFVAYEDGGIIGSGADPVRVLAGGVELRPLFLFRWLRGHEVERATLDLVVDSVGLELGAIAVAPPAGASAWRSGLQAGLGLELPALARANGPWLGLHAGMRWSGDALATGAVPVAGDHSAFVAITLAWHQLFASHIVDLGDEAPR
jgi:hypothetical protein